MWKKSVLSALLSWSWASRTVVEAGVVLSEDMMRLTRDSAYLSTAVYQPSPNITGFETVVTYVDEPNEAVLATKDGYCMVAFRGDSGRPVETWFADLPPDSEKVCNENEDTCCDVRKGFHDVYVAPNYKHHLEFAIRKCVAGCKVAEECLVLTGHSQGGAVASVAALVFEYFDPYVITFGEPPSVEADCPIISPERWYRYVNTVDSGPGNVVIAYDPIPFSPNAGDIVYGQLIILSADTQDVAYIGLDSTKDFTPLDADGVLSHRMVGTEEFPGYLNRIDALMDNAESYPIPATGFRSPNFCTDDIECDSNKCEKETPLSPKQCLAEECANNIECASGRCDSGSCLPKFGSCMACDESSDCISGMCILFRCANFDEKMDDECSCLKDADCESGRCDAFKCEAKLPGGTFCTEHSDCKSDRCTWWFRCTAETIAPAALLSEDTLVSVSDDVFSAWSVVLVASVAGALLAYSYVGPRRRGGYVTIQNTSD